MGSFTKGYGKARKMTEAWAIQKCTKKGASSETGMSFSINKSHFREAGMSFRISEASSERTRFRSRYVIENT